MSLHQNTNFTIHAPGPIDSRLQVNTYASLSNIAVKYIGLKTYVVDEDKEYRYLSSGWTPIEVSNGGGSAQWGSIAGNIADQEDLQVELGLKYNKSGGTIFGNVDVLGTVEAVNFLISGSSAASNGVTFARVVDPPLTATSQGVKGDVAFDINYAYFCIAGDTWVRASVGTWV